MSSTGQSFEDLILKKVIQLSYYSFHSFIIVDFKNVVMLNILIESIQLIVIFSDSRLAAKVTNLVVILRSSILSTLNHTRGSNQYNVSPLGKSPLQINGHNETTSLHSLCRLFQEKQTYIDLRSTGLLRQNISDSQVYLISSQNKMISCHASLIFHVTFLIDVSFGQKTHVSMAMTLQMKVDRNIENRSWATKMAKHVMVINRQMKSRLLDLIHRRLFCTNKINLQKTGN